MIKTHTILLLLAFIIPVAHYDAFAATLNCDRGIISSGDRSIDVISKCGEPVLRESHQEEVSRRLHDDAKLTVFITVDEWTYNFGPARFLQTVFLKNGVVSDIRSGNYGYPNLPESVTDTRDSAYGYMSLPVTAARECGAQIVSVGDTKADVLAQCGEPSFREAHEEEFRQKLNNGEKTVFVRVEEWTYNHGPDRFVRILTFRNSTLTDIRSGGYGYPIGEAE